MESVAHSRQPNKVSVTFPKKTTNGNFSSSKTLYDDVYGGPPKYAASSISPRFEDYREIFASFHAVRASSIPVLDLPAVDAGDVFCDFHTAVFDYAEVFRGFNGLDFWSSHEDLFRDGVSDDEEEAWTPVEIGSFSGELGHFRNHQGIPSGDLFQSVDESTEFNMSYHKVNGTSKTDTSKGKTHITPPHAVPGFTHIVDETMHFQKPDPSLQIVDDIELDMEFDSGKAKGTHHRKDKENPSLQVVDDIELDMEFNAGKAKRTHRRKMMSQPCNVTSGEQVLCCDLDPHDGCSRNDSHTREMFITVSDINLATLPSHLPPPCRPPPALEANKGYTSGFHSNNERTDSEDILGGGSPPFFDVEVDINSSAAVVKEATDRPATRCRSAKELKRRKKGVCDSNIKLSYDVKTNVAKISENITSFNSLNDDRLPASYDWRSSTKKIPATDERQKAKKAAPEISEPSEGESLLNIFEEKLAKESRSSQESEQSTGVCTWKEATEFFELVGTNEFGKVILPINHNKSLLQGTGTYVHVSKEGETSNIQDEYKKVKAIVDSYQPEECKKKSKAARGAYEHGKHIRRSKSSKEESKQREHGRDDELAEFFQLETSEKKTRMVHQHGKTETKVIKADQSVTLKDMVEKQPKDLKRVENEKSKEGDGQTLSEVQCSLKLNKNENKLKQNEEQQLSMKKQKQSQIMKENEKIQKEALAPEAAAHDVIRAKDFEELGKMAERSNEALKMDKQEEHATCKQEYEIIFKEAKQIENKKGRKEACESKELVNGSFKKEESEEGRQRVHGLVENEKGHKKDLEPGLDKTKTEEALKQGKNEACEKDQSINKLGEFCNDYGNRLNERGDSRGTWEVQKQALERESNSGNEVQMKHEIESSSNQAYDREGYLSISNEDSHSKQSKMILKDANKNGKYEGFDKALEQMETNKENIGNLDVSQEPVADREIGEARTDCKIDGRKLGETGVENIIANGKIRASEMPEGKGEHSRTESGKVDHSVADTDELRFSSEQASTEKNKTGTEMEFDPSNQERKIALEWGEKRKIKQHANVVINHEESKDRKSPTQVNLCNDDRRNSIADEPAAVQEAVNVQNTSQRSPVAHSIKAQENSLNETPVSVEKYAEKMRRERELENDRLRKIEEMERERERQKDRMAVNRATQEAEREREREKDRMAVEKATFEARDRAYMEARERAERAAFERKTAEARQIALNEARERLEKACAEARDKSYTNKAAAEARLKAERAAVERATAEARERAMEKVKVERTAFVSRERLERSVSDKFGVSFRNDGIQGSSSSDMQDPHFQNPGSSTGSRYPYSVSGASSFIERSEGEGESAQRCRARLERHRRTSERAAKALEEKNTRDLLAQKEQSERNRLAETLDSEVRRWSSGKEGNLRALLSTLQYILGHDSGWQPIPLTEVITSAAVKKAYRKATLCVHPDKLQQRGASIQHKYVCEKVFDLLKEAWSKFNSEER